MICYFKKKKLSKYNVNFFYLFFYLFRQMGVFFQNIESHLSVTPILCYSISTHRMFEQNAVKLKNLRDDSKA